MIRGTTKPRNPLFSKDGFDWTRLDLLTADHNRVRGLFSQFKDAEEADKTAEQADLAGKIVEELELPHHDFEEEIFYRRPCTTSPSGNLVLFLVDGSRGATYVAKTLIGDAPGLGRGGSSTDGSWRR